MAPSPVIPEHAVDSDIPSCHSCRRRKLKCSREQPSCATCQRTGDPCVYDAKKNKPGLKPGAVESLSKRVEVLEQAFHDRTVQESTTSNCHANTIVSNVAHLAEAITTLASEIRTFTSTGTPLSPSAEPRHGTTDFDRPRKRTKLKSHHRESAAIEHTASPATSSLHLPPGLVEEAVKQYFGRIFYWIPMIHHPRFKDEINQGASSARLGVILDAMVVATLRFMDLARYQLSPDDSRRITEEKRNSVILSAANSLSIENLQALTIIAFTTIGNGEPSRAWAIIASMTRIVDYLRLTAEEEQHGKRQFLKPLHQLSTPTDWVQEEERRRVFWNVFNLDRQVIHFKVYCSLTTGWSPGIKEEEIDRRLPAHGTYWYAEMPVTCPVFSLWKRSVINMGSSETLVHSTGGLVSPLNNQNVVDTTSPAVSGDAALDGPPSTSAMGGFSYAVQATEYLNQIATCFLRPEVDSGDQQQVTVWLTRFKELDLQLVHWKMFLPKKWSDPNRAPDTSTGPHDLDHSMTLAHITHNTSMILLHHRIAYPPARWRHVVPLPSACSAETCLLAATKTSNITETWLRVCPEQIVVPPQISFCTFISARVLLVHCQYHNEELVPDFWVLVRNLEYMAQRWEGVKYDDPRSRSNLAGKYATHLRELYKRWRQDPSMVINVLNYAEPSQFLDGQSTQRDDRRNRQGQDTEVYGHGYGPTTSGTPSTPFVQQSAAIPNLQQGQASNPPFATISTNEMPQVPEDLLAISQALMDQRFIDMDRVITLDDSCFDAASSGQDMSSGLFTSWNSANMGFMDL